MLKCQGRGQGGVIILAYISLFYVSSNVKRMHKNRRTLFGALKYRQTLSMAKFYYIKIFSIYTAIVNRKWFSIICNVFEGSKFASNISSVLCLFYTWNLAQNVHHPIWFATETIHIYYTISIGSALDFELVFRSWMLCSSNWGRLGLAK